MAIVIDALDIVRNKKELPVEAFFVDTNIIINYQDPFGRAVDNSSRARITADLSEALENLKGMGYKRYTTLSVSLEYYKHIQISFYQKFSNKKFDLDDFKNLRDEDAGFMVSWDMQIKAFKKLFIKKFPIFLSTGYDVDIIEKFKGEDVDFGDHLLSSIALSLPKKQQCTFSNDSDFYKFSDELFLLTTEPHILKKAKEDKKILN